MFKYTDMDQQIIILLLIKFGLNHIVQQFNLFHAIKMSNFTFNFFKSLFRCKLRYLYNQFLA